MLLCNIIWFIMHLSELNTGESGIIIKVLGHGGFRRRILEMGFVRGQKVTSLLNAPLKDPIKYIKEHTEIIPLKRYWPGDDVKAILIEFDNCVFNTFADNEVRKAKGAKKAPLPFLPRGG